jgi:predicted Zn-dependent protease
MALVYKAIVHGALRREDLAFAAASRAFALRSRVNERQQRQAEAMYYNFIGDIKQALDRQRLLVSMHPNEASLHRQIAQTYAFMDLVEDAIRHAKAAVDLEPASGNNYMVLASTLAQAGRIQEAEQVLGRGRVRAPDSPVLLSSEAIVKIVAGDPDGALAVLRRLEMRPNYASHASAHMVRCFLIYGRLEEALGRLQADVVRAQVSNDPAHEDLVRYWLAELFNLRSDTRAATAQAEKLAERPAQPYSLFALRWAVETAFEAGSAAALSTASAKLDEIRAKFPSSRSTAFFLQSRGLVEAHSGRKNEARQLLSQARELWPDISSTWALAQNRLADGTFREALPLYQSVVARKGAAIRWDQQVQWVRSHVQAARCLRALGNEAGAIANYDIFLQLWGRETNLGLTKQVLAERKGK